MNKYVLLSQKIRSFSDPLLLSHPHSQWGNVCKERLRRKIDLRSKAIVCERDTVRVNMGEIVNFINVLLTAFALIDPKSIKITVKSSVSFYAFGICERKSCTYNIDKTDKESLCVYER